MRTEIIIYCTQEEFNNLSSKDKQSAHKIVVDGDIFKDRNYSGWEEYRPRFDSWGQFDGYY